MEKVHLILFVADQKRSADFYEVVLGRAPILNVPGMSEFLLPGGAVLGLMPVAGIKRLLGDVLPDPAVAAGIPRTELYLITAEPELYLDRAVAAGGILMSPIEVRDWGDRAGYCLDLDGHLLAFAANIR